jgi:hypothetical protein
LRRTATNDIMETSGGWLAKSILVASAKSGQ